MALLFVLWVMAILCAVALELKFSSHLHMQVTANIGAEMKAFFCARAGVERAASDLLEKAEDTRDRIEQRDEDEREYCNVPIGDGSYTLYAGVDDEGEDRYGLADACAKINANTADATALAKVPGLNDTLAADIIALREREPLQTLDELLAIQDLTRSVLYGEDQNQNGILDPNENDGDTSWPPDNADGRLDRGLAGCLTLWSGVRNVTADGKARVKLNGAAEEEITKTAPEINAQQAQAIVAHRGKSQFASIADLLNVELVEVTEQKPQQGQPPGAKPSGNQQSTQNKTSQDSQSQSTDKQEQKDQQGSTDTEKKDKAADQGTNTANANAQGASTNKPGSQDKSGSGKPQQNVRFTGVKAFDLAAFRKVADLVTTSDSETTPGLININTAPAEVLACLPGIEEDLARGIVQDRQGLKDHYKTVADVLDVDGMSAEIFKGVCQYLTARSDVFEARSFGTLEGQNAYRCVSAILERQENKVRICAWREFE